MTLTLQITDELKARLADQAREAGLDLPEYAARILSGACHSARSAPRTGSELVKYWQDAGVIGSRPDIEDAQAFARTLRESAERRDRD